MSADSELIIRVKYSPVTLPELGEGHVFKSCSFQDLDESKVASVIEAHFLNCSFRDNDLYWRLFFGCLFLNCEFMNCTFRGTTFADCCFVECVFKGCNFIPDKLDDPCDFKGTRWYACTQTNCHGLEGVW
jgi:uncharacterized protein YjbI with pentapeptide repeats